MSDAGATATPASGNTRVRSPYVIAVICGMAAFMEVLDMSIANVSLLHIAGSLSASREEATWVLTSYLVANAIILPMTGWLSDRIGRKRYYLGSLAIFTLASVACGLAPSLEMLILGRVVQGMAGGALQPVSQAILNEAFPPEKRGMAIAVYGLAVIVGPALGPPLGGFLTDQYSWHWIFLINAPVGVLLFMLGMYRNRTANMAIFGASVLVFAAALWVNMNQISSPADAMRIARFSQCRSAGHSDSAISATPASNASCDFWGYPARRTCSAAPANSDSATASRTPVQTAGMKAARPVRCR